MSAINWSPNSDSVRCYNCSATVTAKLQKVSQNAGHVGYKDPNLNVTVYVPTSRERWAAVCPSCGAIFQSAEADKKNNEEDQAAMMAVIVSVSVVVLIFLVIILSMYLDYVGRGGR